MKPFDLEAAKSGAPVCTRDGRDVRIICYDKQDDYGVSLVGLVKDGTCREFLLTVHADGRYKNDNSEDPRDLMMKTVKKEGWMVINRKHIGEDLYESKEHAISAVEEAARKYGDEDYAVAHIEWEE